MTFFIKKKEFILPSIATNNEVIGYKDSISLTYQYIVLRFKWNIFHFCYILKINFFFGECLITILRSKFKINQQAILPISNSSLTLC